MKVFLAILVLLGTLPAGAQDKGPKAELVESAARVAGDLKPFIEEDWVVEAKQDEIVLTSRFEIFQVGFFRGPGDPPMPQFSDAIPHSELMEKGGPPKKFVIRLIFSQPLSHEEFSKRVAERQKAARALEYGTKTKDEYNEAGQTMMKIAVPRYRFGTYHVFERSSESPFARIFPPAAIKKVGAARAILAEVLNLMPTGTDPSKAD